MVAQQTHTAEQWPLKAKDSTYRRWGVMPELLDKGMRIEARRHAHLAQQSDAFVGDASVPDQQVDFSRLQVRMKLDSRNIRRGEAFGPAERRATILVVDDDVASRLVLM